MLELKPVSTQEVADYLDSIGQGSSLQDITEALIAIKDSTNFAIGPLRFLKKEDVFEDLFYVADMGHQVICQVGSEMWKRFN